MGPAHLVHHHTSPGPAEPPVPRRVLFSCIVPLLLLMEHGCILAAGQPSLISGADRLTFVEQARLDLNVVQRCGCRVLPRAGCFSPHSLGSTVVLAEGSSLCAEDVSTSFCPSPESLHPSNGTGRCWAHSPHFSGGCYWLLLVPHGGAVPFGCWDVACSSDIPSASFSWLLPGDEAGEKAALPRYPSRCQLPISPRPTPRQRRGCAAARQ